MFKTQSSLKSVLSIMLMVLFAFSFTLFCGCNLFNGDKNGDSSNSVNNLDSKNDNGGVNYIENSLIPTEVPSTQSVVVGEYFLVADGNKLTGLTDSGKRQTSLTIPSSIEVICDHSFRNNNKISSITLPTSLRAIGYGAFLDCTNLKSVYINDLAAYVQVWVYILGSPTYNGATMYCNGSKVTSIDYTRFNMLERSYVGGFEGCTSITSIKLDENVVGFFSAAFRNCVNLTSITNVDRIRYIRSCAFSGCTGLTNVSFTNAEKLEKQAFLGCSNLTLTIPRECTLGEDAIKNVKQVNYLN